MTSDFNPKVSIVIPVYNGSNYLAQAIDSALAQTYQNIEILVVDDGSTDNGATRDVASGYGGRVRYIHKENGGVSSALNVGIGHMAGEYFSWLSHDDIFCPDKIETQIEYIRNNRGARFVCGEFEKIDAEGNTLQKIGQDNYSLIDSGRKALSVYIFGCATLIHRSCFEEVGLFNENNRTTSDDEMWLRIIKKFPLHYINKVMCKERQHATQVGVSQRLLHGQNRLMFFEYIHNECDINWFIDDYEKSNYKSTRQARSEAYSWIGSYALRLDCFKGVDIFMKSAVREWPFNLYALNVLFFRPRIVARIIKYKANVAGALASLKKRWIGK